MSDERKKAEEIRDLIKAVADEWCETTLGGWDVVASACLDDIEKIIAEVRP